MAIHDLTTEAMQETVDAVTKYGGITKASNALKLRRTTLQHRYQVAIANGITPTKQTEFTVAALPDPDLSIDDLIAHRIKQFSKKKAYEDARRLVTVHVKIDGPIGIWHFGDPHIDDDGTDLEAIQQHTQMIRTTPGLFGANVGDTTNNWIGRLARLWAEQSTSAEQSWKLAEWFLNRVEWLYLIGGNHDAWSGTGDPIRWIRRKKTTPYMPSEVRLELVFPNKNTCRINARHDFAGHSQYNPVHGPMKANLFGVRDHINVAGHKHVSGHGVLKNPDDGSVCHSFLVASYKLYDRYARDHGFRDQHISPGVLTIVNPALPSIHPDFISHYWDLEYGVSILKAIRSRK